MHCTHLKELVLEEKRIIENNLEEYKTHYNIQDNTKAKIRFIQENCCSMRKNFCYNCIEKNACDVYENLLKKI